MTKLQYPAACHTSHCVVVFGSKNNYCFQMPVTRFEFTWIDLALTSLLANQPVASDSECARDQLQCAAVTAQVNLSFSFVSWVIKHLIEFITIESQ